MRKAAQETNNFEEIELVHKLSSKKRGLIDSLLTLVIQYNKHYYYNLFDRNCQNFVLDALKILEISIPKELPGNLGGYYKALVKGKTPSIPSLFETHSSLDEYIMDKMREGVVGEMPQHDLEFLLALYFRFHLESKAKLKNDSKALEEWHCEEQHCQMGEVERFIEIESLKIHNL